MCMQAAIGRTTKPEGWQAVSHRAAEPAAAILSAHAFARSEADNVRVYLCPYPVTFSGLKTSRSRELRMTFVARPRRVSAPAIACALGGLLMSGCGASGGGAFVRAPISAALTSSTVVVSRNGTPTYV